MYVPAKLSHKEALDMKSIIDISLTTPKILHGDSGSILFPGVGVLFSKDS